MPIRVSGLKESQARRKMDGIELSLVFLSLAGHWNEPHRDCGSARNAVLSFFNNYQILVRAAHGADQQPPFLKLIDQRLRHFSGSGGYNNPVERRNLRPAGISVPYMKTYILISEPF